MPIFAAFFLCVSLFLAGMPAQANEPGTINHREETHLREPGSSGPFELIIKDHKFTPETLTIPADQKVVITVKNHDASAEEFESHDLKIEKIVPANGEIKVTIKPLKPGTYEFVGEFHEETAKGSIVVQ